jgi:uncharacterized Zn finger protein
MPRENAAAKGQRLLAEGRVIVKSITPQAVTASVRGDSGLIYTVVGDLGGWSCPCDALTRCSHIQAVALVTLRPI